MNESDLSYLKIQLTELKLMLKNPRIFIVKYFGRLRNHLDLEITQYLNSSSAANFKSERDDQNNRYLSLVETLIEKEKEYLNYVNQKFRYDTTFEEKMMKDINEYEKSLTDQNLLIHNLKDLIYKSSSEIQRILFRNESFIILNKETLKATNIFDSKASPSSQVFYNFCNLIKIENGFIGERSIEYLK